MRRQSILGWMLVLCLALGFGASTAVGQAVYGSLVGAVTDPQGNAVAGAKVTVTNTAKGTTEETTTNESGNYSVTHLIPDSYKIRVEASGFKGYDIASVRVDADTTVRADAALQVGTVTQTVEVTGEIPQLQSDRADVATIFTDQQVESIPIFNRNFTTLQLFAPGAQLQGWGHAASENPQASRQILTNGQHFAGTGFELDGTDNQDPILGIIVINPNLESINEVKVTTQDYDAEFGKAIGSIVTSQTKSGTNELHGSAFDFERSNSNFARDPFAQATTGVPSGNWNQFGGTLGGPIVKNKLFLFGDYQGQRAHVGGTARDRILTGAERNGDFSDLIIGCPNPSPGKPCIPIFDPYQTTDATHQTLVLDAKGQPIPLGNTNRTQFPGNIIPASRLTGAGAIFGSQQAQNILKLIPTGATLADPTVNNFAGSGSNVLNADNFDVRSDYVLNSKTQVFGRYSYQKFLRSGPGLFGAVAGGAALPADSGGQFAGASHVKNQSLATGFDYVFSPTLLTDFRFGYMRYNVAVAPGGVGTTPAKDAGIPGLNIDPLYSSGMPYFHVTTSGLPDFNFGYSLGANQCNCPLTEQEHQYQFVNNWTKIRGNHSFKFGADIRRAYNLRIPSDKHRAGELSFSGDQTQGPGGVGGSGLAAFLLGDVTFFERYVSVSTDATETQPRFFFFGQDTWRVTNKLSVNMGLRWEIYRPESVAGTGKGGWVDAGTGEVRIAGTQGVDLRGNTSTSYKHFAPRLGVAYQWNPKTVVRLGYGRSYDIGVFGSIFGHAVTQNVPVLASQQTNTSNGQDSNTAFFLSNGPPTANPATALGGTLATSNCNAITDPSGVVGGVFTPDKPQCVGVNGRPLLPDGLNAFVRPFNNRLPSVDAWNATVQRQVTSTISATVSYVGNKGTHTIGGGPDYPFNNPKLAGYDPNLTGAAAVAAQNARRPFFSKYGWTQGFRYFGNDFNNKYNALQVTVEKRFASGLSFNGNYTFQHARADLDGGTAGYDKSVNYGPNDNYRNHVFILTQVYQLPFGKGKKYAGDVGRIGDLLIGGWELNGATNFSSGLPFTPGLQSCHASSDTGPCRPDLVGPVKAGTRSGHPDVAGYWFQGTNGVQLVTAGQSSGSWAQPAVDTFGNVGRNSLRGPKYFDSDLALFKNFSITEKAKAQFQFQFYNVFNHVNLGNPDGCVDCGNTGRITGIASNSQLRSLTYGFKLSF
jgi:outer membrane receptor protein involved in Fe transport